MIARPSQCVDACLLVVAMFLTVTGLANEAEANLQQREDNEMRAGALNDNLAALKSAEAVANAENLALAKQLKDIEATLAAVQQHSETEQAQFAEEKVSSYTYSDHCSLIRPKAT